MGLFDFIKTTPEKPAALELYRTIVGQARLPGFYLNYGVPDTVDGRFDMIALHAFLVLHRLKKDHGETEKLTQSLFDLLFADMDQNLRELGVGDLSVGKRIQKMAAAFQGRVVAYENGLDDTDQLCEALMRNVYRHVVPERNHVLKLARYVRDQADALESQATEQFVSGTVSFSAVPEDAPS